jgi:serine/threonine protein kinase
MWSIGCISYELGSLLCSGKVTSLLPGTSCHPLSPHKNQEATLVEDTDQLLLILNTLKSYDTLDFSWVQNEAIQ